MVTLTLTRGEFEEIYDAVRDLPDIYKSELNEDEFDQAHIDLFNAVQKMQEINSDNYTCPRKKQKFNKFFNINESN